MALTGMQISRFQIHSLKTRIILLNLLTILALFLFLSFYARDLVREELIRFTGEQQRSALSLLTTQVNHALMDRLAGLDAVAAQVTPAMIVDPRALQRFLADRKLLARLFSGGMLIWSPVRGTPVEARFVEDQSLTQALGPDEVARVLRDRKPLIGRLQTGVDRVGSVALAVPILDAQGAAIGVMAGVIRLDNVNFLNQLTAHGYGERGNFFLIESQQRLIFATSDKARVMEVLPGAGVNPHIDRFVQGFEGTTVAVNPHGLAVLVSVQQIPLAGWYASVTLPYSEATGLIEVIAPRIRLAALFLILLALSLLFLLLRRQLAPMTSAVRTLDGFVRQDKAPEALQVVRPDEIGQLVSGFNRLLDTLNQQTQVLQQSELFKQAVLNSVTAEIAVLDNAGLILAVNEAWLLGASQRGSAAAVVGANYLPLCAGAAAREGIEAVLAGKLPNFHLDYACHTPVQQRWCSISVTPLEGAALLQAVVSIEDITVRVQIQEQVRALAFYDPLTQLPNRRLMQDRLAKEMARSRRLKGLLALLFIDLDNFKPINDEMGHAVGDTLLSLAAQRIQDCLRGSDTAARLGGDEFVVLLPDLPAVDAAMVVAEKIRLELARPFITGEGLSLSISASIGVALYPDHGLTEKDLMHLGDEAMYLAKKAGRNAVVLYSPQSPAPPLLGT